MDALQRIMEIHHRLPCTVASGRCGVPVVVGADKDMGGCVLALDAVIEGAECVGVGLKYSSLDIPPAPFQSSGQFTSFPRIQFET